MSVSEKKRRRIPYSCILCRKKKIKCDKLKPSCSRCTKSGSECEYEDTPLVWMGNNSQNVGIGLFGTVPATRVPKKPNTSNINHNNSFNNKSNNNRGVTIKDEVDGHNDQIHGSGHRLYNNIADKNDSMHVFEFSGGSSRKVSGTSMIKSPSANSSNSRSSTSANQSPYNNNNNNNMPSVQVNSNSIPPDNVINFQIVQPTHETRKEAMLEQIVFLKSKLYALEQKIKESDESQTPNDNSTKTEIGDVSRSTISMYDSITPNKPGFLFASKKNRFMCLGSFQKIVLWKRDPLIRLLTETFYGNMVNIEKRDPSHVLKMGNDLSKQIKYRKETSLNLKSSRDKDKEKKKRKLNKNKNGDSENVKDLDLSTDELLNKVLLESLPPKEIIDFHTNRYFKFIHPFLPIIDEENLKLSLNTILKFSENHQTPSLLLVNKMDYITLSTLLLMVRFSYMLIADDEDRETVEMKRRYPIDANITFLVKTCILRSNFIRKSSLEILWLLMLYRFYNQVAPEDGDGGDGSDSFIFCGVLFQTALSMGLNRELLYADNNKLNTFQNERSIKHGGASSNFITNRNFTFVKIWNKTWWSLVKMDVDLSMSFGKSLVLNMNESNTKIPAGDDSDFIVSKIRKFSIIYPVISRLINSLHNINEKPLVLDVISDLRILESLKDFHYKISPVTSADLLLDQKLQLVDSFINQVKLSSCLMIIYYILLIKYELLKDSQQYLTTMFKLHDISLKLILLSFDAIGRCNTGNLKSFSKLVTPPMMLSLSRIFQILICFVLRFKSAQLKFHNQTITAPNTIDSEMSKKIQMINSCVLSLNKLMRVLLRFFKFSSQTYYYAVRTVDQFSYIVDCIENTGGYPIFSFTKGVNYQANFINDLTSEQLTSFADNYQALLDDPILLNFKNNPYFDPIDPSQLGKEKSSTDAPDDANDPNTKFTFSGIAINSEGTIVSNGNFMSLSSSTEEMENNVMKNIANSYLKGNVNEVNPLMTPTGSNTPETYGFTPSSNQQNSNMNPVTGDTIATNHNNSNDSFLYDNMGGSNLLEDLLSTNDLFDTTNPTGSSDPFTFFM